MTVADDQDLAGKCPVCVRCADGGQGHSAAELAQYHSPKV